MVQSFSLLGAVGYESAVGTALLVFFLCIACVVVFSAPKLGMFLAWTVVLCYPRNSLVGALPLNAPLSDAYLLLAAASTALWSFRRQGQPWAHGVVWVAAGMVLMQALADLTGGFHYQELMTAVMRNSLKGVVLIIFTWALASDIRTQADVRRHALGLTVAAGLAFLIVIVCYYVPAAAEIWEVRLDELDYLLGTAGNRAWGPFNGPADIGGVECLVIPLMLGLLFYNFRDRLVRYAALLTLATTIVGGVFLAKTRSGVLGLVVMGTMIVLFSKRRWYMVAAGVVCLLAVGYFVMSGSSSISATEERFQAETLSEDTAVRTTIWKIVISNPSPAIAFFGEGVEAMKARLDWTPHNGYLDVLFCWGMGGVIMFTVLIRSAVKWGRKVLRQDTDPLCQGVAWGILWALVASAGNALTNDPWYSYTFRFVLYGMLAIVCFRYQVIQQEELACDPAALLPEGLPAELIATGSPEVASAPSPVAPASS